MASRFRIALPHPHFMACAPLDVWARLLLGPGGRVRPRYWVRLAGNLASSALATAVSLPERLLLAPVLFLAGRACSWKLPHGPGVVAVLGYYRSGTTHLHYLLSCDERTTTPKWFHCLIPQGFALTWNFARLFLVPFMGAKRPIDDVAYGPEWPMEDEFAVNNWSAASALPARMVIPNAHEHYSRFHSLRGLSAAERARWRRTTWAFLWKLTRLSPRRTLLLKTPAHTARVRELLDLFGAEKVKFVLISRDPGAVVRSKLAINDRIGGYLLQELPDRATLREQIVEEYDETMRAYDEDRALIPAGHAAEMRFEDLRADPIGELKRVYAELGIAWTERFERRLAVYLDSVKNYKPAGDSTADPTPLEERLRWIIPRFGHDRPARPRVEPVAPAGEGLSAERRALRIAVSLPVAFFVAVIAWIAGSYFTEMRQGWVVWPVGILLGYVSLWAARKGTVRLGIVAAVLTFLAFEIVSFVNTSTVVYGLRVLPGDNFLRFARNPHEPVPISLVEELIPQTLKQLTKWHQLFWLGLGCMTAYRFASREHVHPIGRDRLA